MTNPPEVHVDCCDHPLLSEELLSGPWHTITVYICGRCGEYQPIQCEECGELVDVETAAQCKHTCK